MQGRGCSFPWTSLLALAASAVLACSADRGDGADGATSATPTPWVWRREEDVSFLPAGSRVAYLAATARVESGILEVVPRRHALVTPDRVRLLPVLRLEASPKEELASPIVEHVVDLALELAARPESIGVQIDFDASISQRTAYRLLLRRLRTAMPHESLLSVAALASWCVGDRWLRETGVDEVVPMLYRMGPEGGAIRARLDRGLDFPAVECRAAVGLSSDEPIPRLAAGRRLYLFSDLPWTQARWNDQLARAATGGAL